MNERRYWTIGTAGHVDHGKSTLVEALTGVHPDRLEEERERGLSIELGFAFLSLGEGVEVPIIDVPGHERFLKTTVAGVTGIDLVLFVVAADEGVMPQTVEHLSALELLGLQQGLVVLTKCDLVDEEWLLLVEEDLRVLLADTFLEGAPFYRVSAMTGTGLEALVEAIKTSLAGLPARPQQGVFRLAVDRAFSMKGFGTVITGTVRSGHINDGDEVEVLPTRVRVRIRGIQTHNTPVKQVFAGQRAALNLANIKADELERGFELSVPGYLMPTPLVDAQVRLPKYLKYTLKNRDRIRFHIGTNEVIGRAVLLDHDELQPGQVGWVQFRLESSIVAERHDRFLIRGFSSMRIIGGGSLLDIYPTKHRRFKEPVLRKLQAIASASPEELVEQVLLQAYGTRRIRSLEALVQETNLGAEALTPLLEKKVEAGAIVALGGGLFMHRQWYDQLQQDLLERLAGLHQTHRTRESLPREMLRSQLSFPIDNLVYDHLLTALEAAGAIEMVGSGIRKAGHTVALTPQEQEIKQQVLALFEENHFVSRSLNDIQQHVQDQKPALVKAVLTHLFDHKVLVEIRDKVVFRADLLEQARTILVDYLKQHETIRATEYRDLLNTSRSMATSLLDYFYDQKITIRESGTHRLRQSGPVFK